MDTVTCLVRRFDELTTAQLYAIMKARVDVFVVEQDCPYAELDDRDQTSIHVWLEDDMGILSYLRVLPPGVEAEYPAIGRVLTLRRGEGYGARVLREGLKAAYSAFGHVPVYLEAQTYAKGFYEKLGFHTISDEFILDGIPHIQMIRESP